MNSEEISAEQRSKGLLLTIVYGLGPGWRGVAQTLQMDCKVHFGSGDDEGASLRPFSVFPLTSLSIIDIMSPICLQSKKMIAIAPNLNYALFARKRKKVSASWF
jgi:hypothetical protein